MEIDISGFVFEYEDIIKRIKSTTESSSGYMYNLNYILKNVDELFELIESNKDLVIKWCFEYLKKNRKTIWLKSGIYKWSEIKDDEIIKKYWEPLYPLVVGARESLKRYELLKPIEKCFVEEIKAIHEGKKCEYDHWWLDCELCEKQEYQWKDLLITEMKLTGNILLEVNNHKIKEYIEKFPFDAPIGWEPPRLKYEEKFKNFNSPDIDLSGNKTISQEIQNILPNFLYNFNLFGYYWNYDKITINEYNIFFRLWNNYDFLLYIIKSYRLVFKKLRQKQNLIS